MENQPTPQPSSPGGMIGLAPIKPSIGRIVIYNHPGSADGKFPPKQSPAIIQKVNMENPDDNQSTSVELVVFSVYGGMFFNHNVEQGDGPSQWNWPERV